MTNFYSAPPASASAVAPAPTGVAATDTAALQALIDTATATASGSAPNVTGGGTVELRAGTYVVTGLVLKPLVRLRGRGRNLTRIQLAASSNTDVIKGQNFDTLAGTDSITGAVYGAALIGLTIDGNKANNASGRGVAIYGYANHYDDIRITNCIGLGLVHDSHSTSSFGSDSLATGTMECDTNSLLVDRCNGGGVDWQGPSDSQMSKAIIAKNGSVTVGSTTVGLKVSRNGQTMQINTIHVWGNQHKIGIQAEVAIDAVNVESEGAQYAEIWLRSSGNKIVNPDLYSPGVSTAYGIVIGDLAGAVYSGDNHILGGRLNSLGIFFDKDAGNNTIITDYYWADNTKTFFTGTQNASNGNKISVGGGPRFGGKAALGSMPTNAEVVAMTSDIPTSRCLGYPAGTKGASLFDSATSDSQTLTTVSTSAFPRAIRVPVVPGDVISAVSFITGSTAGATLTHRWAGIALTSDLSVVGKSADDTSASWAADTAQTFTLTAPYTVPTGVIDLWAFLVVVGTTMPSYEGHQFQQTGTIAAMPVRTAQATAGPLTDPASLGASLGALGSAASKVPIVWLT